MTVQTANLAATASGSAVLYKGSAHMYTVHWTTATNDVGSITFHNATSSAGTVLLRLDTPIGKNGGAAGDFPISGGGLRFTDSIFVNTANTGGVTISFNSAT